MRKQTLFSEKTLSALCVMGWLLVGMMWIAAKEPAPSTWQSPNNYSNDSYENRAATQPSGAASVISGAAEKPSDLATAIRFASQNAELLQSLSKVAQAMNQGAAAPAAQPEPTPPSQGDKKEKGAWY